MKKLFLLNLVISLIFLIGIVGAITGSIGNAQIIVNGNTGDNIEKTILVKNVNDIPVNITLEIENGASFLELINNSFILQSNEEKNARINVKILNNMQSEGKINVRFHALEGEDADVVLSSIIKANNLNNLKKDVAYVVKDSSKPNQQFIKALNDLGYSYELIGESQVAKTDFTKYRMILLGNEKIKDVPVENFNSLIVNPSYYPLWSASKGSLTSNHIQTAYNSNKETEITKDVRETFNVYTATKTPSGISLQTHYLDRTKRTGVLGITLTSNKITDRKKYAIAIKENPKRVFFGITESEYWTQDSKKLFYNSIEWILMEDNNPPQLDSEIPIVQWEKNNAANINLNDYFSDPNEDDLTYGVDETSSNIGINVNLNPQTGAVQFTSQQGFTGEDWIVFKAIDEHGAETRSNLVILKVINPVITTQPPVLNNIEDINALSGSLVKITPSAADVDTSQENLVFIFVYPFNENGEWQIPLELTGTFTTIVKVQDPDNNFDEQEVKIFVSDMEHPLIENIGTKTVNEGESLTFIVSASDPKNDSLTLTAVNLPLGAGFTDNGDSTGVFSWTPTLNQSGTYQVTFTAQDNESYTNNKTVSIIVKDIKETPRFSDADLCESKSDLLSLIIKDPDDGDNFKIKDEIDVEAEVENNANENLDVDVEFHLYDLNKDRSIDDQKENMDVDKNDKEKFKTKLKIPFDAENNDLAILAIANGKDKNKVNYCNYEYIEIEIEREEHDVIIDEIKANPNTISPGESSEVEVKIKNIGENDENIYVELKSAELSINEKSEIFELEEFSQDDSEKKNLRIFVPSNTKSGVYQIIAKVYFDDGSMADEKTFKITVVGSPVNENSDDKKENDNENNNNLIIQNNEEIVYLTKNINAPVLNNNEEDKVTLLNNKETVKVKNIKPVKKTEQKSSVSWKMDNSTKNQVLWIVNITLIIGIILIFAGIIRLRR